MPVLTCGHGILCKPAETPMDISQMPVCAVIYLKNAGSPPRTPVLLRACVVERRMEASLRGNLPEKCRTPFPGHPFCASLRGRNAHGHFTRASLRVHLLKQCRTPMRPPRLNTGPLVLPQRPVQCGHTVWEIEVDA